jgi:hypothetical protein
VNTLFVLTRSGTLNCPKGFWATEDRCLSQARLGPPSEGLWLLLAAATLDFAQGWGAGRLVLLGLCCHHKP